MNDRRHEGERRDLDALEVKITELEEELEQRTPGRRTLKERRKMIEVRDGYIYRNTKIALYAVIACAVVVAIGIGVFFFHQHREAAANALQSLPFGDSHRVVFTQKWWDQTNLIETVNNLVLAIAIPLELASASLYFFIKGKNKKEFSFEIADADEEIEKLEEELKKQKKYRQGDK